MSKCQPFGCTAEQWATLRQIGADMEAAGSWQIRTPLGAFSAQRFHAKRRGIEWQLTIWEWWTIWQRSGKWSQRGRRHDEYCMCRRGDIGPYAVGNVFIGTVADNCSITKNKFTGLPRGVSIVTGANGRKFYFTRCCLNGKPTHIGTFKTPEEAHAAYLVARYPERQAEAAA